MHGRRLTTCFCNKVGRLSCVIADIPIVLKNVIPYALGRNIPLPNTDTSLPSRNISYPNRNTTLPGQRRRRRRRLRRRCRRRRRRGCDWTSRCRGLLVDACVRACGLWSVVVAVSVVVVVVVAEAVVVMIVVGGSSHLEFLSRHRALPFALRALVGAQGSTCSYEIRGEPLSEHRATRLVMRFVSGG